MTSDLTKSLVRKISSLYNKKPEAKLLFDAFAQRERDASYTTIARLEKVTSLDRTAAIAFAQELADAGCGKYIVGRRGNVSRIEWDYSCISLGKAASGKAEDIAEVAQNSQADAEPGELPGEISPDLKLTISQAKEVLARSLAIPIESIEIIIKG